VTGLAEMKVAVAEGGVDGAGTHTLQIFIINIINSSRYEIINQLQNWKHNKNSCSYIAVKIGPVQ
jgi:hypothetical protein